MFMNLTVNSTSELCNKAHSRGINGNPSPLQTTGGQHVWPQPITAQFLHSTMEPTRCLVNTGRVGQHSTPSRNQTIPHLLPRRQFSTPYKEPFSSPLPQPAGVWVKGDGLRIRTITWTLFFLQFRLGNSQAPQKCVEELFETTSLSWRNVEL